MKRKYNILVILAGMLLLMKVLRQALRHSQAADWVIWIVLAVSVLIYILYAISLKKSARKAYSNKFTEITDGAFENSRSNRNKMYDALYYYDNDKCKKTLKIAEKLKKKCVTDEDKFTVAMISALSYNDLERPERAVAEYREALGFKNDSTAWSNMGLILKEQLFDYDKAEQAYLKAIEADDKNHMAYNNIAGLCYSREEYGKAIYYAEKAVELKENMTFALNILALSYAAKGNFEESEKYARKSIANGYDEQVLRNALSEYEKNDTEE